MIEPVRAKKNAEQGEEEDDGAGKKQVFPSSTNTGEIDHLFLSKM